MPPIIQVQGVSKKYSRKADAHLSYGLRDLLAELVGRRKSETLRQDEFFAVDDVSFDMQPGDSLALVGRNGSGKTTLLKMMNGLTKPDAGRIVMRGRIQALINLGAGFNGSLSGHDNVLNAASLMGMNGQQAKGILDEVVDFSELEDFIDSPFGTYSSGMKARLGFAVAVYLKPEILLVDEILAVGDYAFQNKCYHKIQEMRTGGVTFVLVTHVKQRVLQLCESALWVHQGVMRAMGPAKETMKAYMDFLDELELKKLRKEEAKKQEKESSAGTAKSDLYGPIHDNFDHIEDLETAFEVNADEVDMLRSHQDVTLRYKFRLKHSVADLHTSLVFHREDGLLISGITTINGDLLRPYHDGAVCCKVGIPDFDLNPGKYVLVLVIHDGRGYLYRNVIKRFVVQGDGRHVWGVKDFLHDYHVSSG